MYDTNGTTSGANPEADDMSYAYLYNANGDVGQVADPNGPPPSLADPNSSLRARYEYDPYGLVIGPDTDGDGQWTDDAGSYAARNAFRFSTKQWDDATGLGYWGYRYYSAKLGRWLTRDPAGETSGAGLYVFCASRSPDRIDPLGENLYAVDGTWADWGEGTNTEYIYRLTREPKRYWNGPNDGPSGSDSAKIADGVYATICSDLDAACRSCEAQPTINLAGWSRGAAIVTWVAHRLGIVGCHLSCTGETVHPTVNWLGLFDAVDMSPAIPDWAMTAPSNVRMLSHAVKTGTSEHLYPTAPIYPAVYFWRYNGEPTTHGDIGANTFNNNAFAWMREQARTAGVEIW